MPVRFAVLLDGVCGKSKRGSHASQKTMHACHKKHGTIYRSSALANTVNCLSCVSETSRLRCDRQRH